MIPLRPLFVTPLFLSLTSVAHAQTFDWAATFQGDRFERFNDIAIDSGDNTYAVGAFEGTVDFDPGPGLSEVTAQGSGLDGYIWKLDSAGQLVSVWHLSTPSAGFVSPEGIALDASGNIYVAGRFTRTTDFDPGPGVFNLTPTANTEAFVLKLDSAGNFLWAVLARSMFGSATLGQFIDVDPSGTSIYVSGYFTGFGDFDPGPGTASLNSTGSAFDTYVWKLDGAGNFVWVRQLECSGPITPQGVKLDSQGNVCIGGWFRGAADMDPGPGTFPLPQIGTTDSYACKLNSAGDLVWARAVGGSSDTYASGMTVDSSDQLILVGEMRGTVNFDPTGSGETLTSAGGSDAFLWKLDSAGNHVWARRAGGANGAYAAAVTTDSNGDLYAAGAFNQSADFGPFDVASSHAVFTPNSSQSDAFLTKLDADGNFLWFEQVGADGWNAGRQVELDSGENIFFGGWYENTVDFDFGPGVFETTQAGNQGDPFLLKLSQSTETTISSCFGNGSGANCPCGNDSQEYDAGCRNSSGRGAVLRTDREDAILSNGLSFGLEGAALSSFGILLSGDNLLGSGQGVLGNPLADGLRCIGGNSLRHGTRAIDGLGNSLNPWGTGVGIIAQSGFIAGQTRHFQARYRDNPGTSPCGTDQNTSQALSVTFIP